MDTNPPITDSPWFWVLIFSGMALVALLVIGPKYSRRQAGIEVKYQARERIADARATENHPPLTAANPIEADERDFAAPDTTLIPLWPLALVLAVVMIFSIVMLVRGRGRPSSLIGNGPSP